MKLGSSQLIEFFIAFAVGFLAVLAAVFCIGFLLVEPVNDPNGLDTTNTLPCTYHCTRMKGDWLGSGEVIGL